MGLFDALFGKPDPSQAWIADPGLKLELDLDAHTLCGIRLGDSVESIARLGPPDSPKEAKDGLYEYASKGIQIVSEDRSVCTFEIAFHEKEFVPFEGTCRYRGKTISLNAEVCVDDFVRQFGEPYWRDEGDDETILFYEFGTTVEWQVEFNRSNLLYMLLIDTPPLMADPEQRKEYGVDKAWPPHG